MFRKFKYLSQLHSESGKVYKHISVALIRKLSYRDNFGTFSLIKNVGSVCRPAPLPDTIIKPDYYKTCNPSVKLDFAEVKTAEQIEKMRSSCHLARLTMQEVTKHVKVGISTEELDTIACQFIVDNGAYPSPRNYRGFPKNICTSVNNVSCHGIPDDRQLENGDMISIDVTVFLNGFHGDCCDTVGVGEVDQIGNYLINAAEESRDAGISICGPDVPFMYIGAAIEQVIEEKKGLSVVPCFTGHGIGSYFHGPPDIFHCYNDFEGVMQPGMTFTVEPVIAQGNGHVDIHPDGWTAFVSDKGRAAQFEHTILITSHGFEILT